MLRWSISVRFLVKTHAVGFITCSLHVDSGCWYRVGTIFCHQMIEWVWGMLYRKSRRFSWTTKYGELFWNFLSSNSVTCNVDSFQWKHLYKVVQNWWLVYIIYIYTWYIHTYAHTRVYVYTHICVIGTLYVYMCKCFGYVYAPCIYFIILQYIILQYITCLHQKSSCS